MNLNKKGVYLFVFWVLLTFALINYVNAASVAKDFGVFLDSSKEVLTMFFGKILGEGSVGSNVFFERVLILLVVFGIIYSVLGKINIFAGNGFFLFFVSAAVSILGIRFLNDEFISAILLPYGALGASVAVFLPLLIYFAFVQTSVKGVFGRRVAWFLYLIVFVALLFTNWRSSITDWMYVAGLAFILISIMFDPQIHKYLGLYGASRDMAYRNTFRKAQIMKQIQEADRHRDEGRLTEAEYKEIRRRLDRSLKNALSNT